MSILWRKKKKSNETVEDNNKLNKTNNLNEINGFTHQFNGYSRRPCSVGKENHSSPSLMRTKPTTTLSPRMQVLLQVSNILDSRIRKENKHKTKYKQKEEEKMKNDDENVTLTTIAS